MERLDYLLIGGIVATLIWLLACILTEGKKRRYVVVAGVIIDSILFIICRNHEMLLTGAVGGIVCGLIPGISGSRRKYEIAVRELNGVGNWVVVSTIFFVMIFMVIALVYPDVKIEM